MAKNVNEVGDANFDNEVLKSGQPVLVDFWAEWCGPCKMLAPTIESVADDFAGKVKVFKVNVDENPNTAVKYRVRSIPTMIFFKNGQEINRIKGILMRDRLRRQIEGALLAT